MHNIEKGHKCTGCRRKLLCTIEDGYCENDGIRCNQCLLKADVRYRRRSFRSEREEENYNWRVAQQENQDRTNPMMW